MKTRSKLAWLREKRKLYWQKPLSKIKRTLILQTVEAMVEDVVEVTTEITLKTLKEMKMKSLKTNLRSCAITVKERGILRMNAESPKRKDKRTLRRKHT